MCEKIIRTAWLNVSVLLPRTANLSSRNGQTSRNLGLAELFRKFSDRVRMFVGTSTSIPFSSCEARKYALLHPPEHGTLHVTPSAQLRITHRELGQ